MLIVTGTAHGDPAADTAGPFRARWRERTDMAPTWRARLLQSLGADVALADHCAGTVARARGQPDASAWLAAPVHLVAGIDRVFLPREGLLRLEDDEWLALCAGFARQFGGDGLRLEPVAADAALLLGAALTELVTHEPLDCVGEDLRQRLPCGPGAGRWRALAGEIELWLHGEAWNRERERRGQPPVTSLWLWGGPAAVGGGSPRSAEARRECGSPWWLVGEDPWLAALPALLRHCASSRAAHFDALLRLQPPARGAAVLWRADAGLPELERRWLGPARRALASGALAMLSVHQGPVCWQLDRAARWRWWQPQRTLAPLAPVAHG